MPTLPLPAAARGPKQNTRRERALTGAVLAFLPWLAIGPLGVGAVPFFQGGRWVLLFLPAACAGALIGMTRARVLLWMAAAWVSAVYLIAGCTPYPMKLAQRLVRDERPERCDAVVVLSSSVDKQGRPDLNGQVRLLRGYELLQQGFAHDLVITRVRPPLPSAAATVREQLGALGLKVTLHEVGPIHDTHDEALAVARLVSEKGWRRVILVTDGTHSRRAAAVFEKAGVPLLSAPCEEPAFDFRSSGTPMSRIRALRYYVKESVGYYVYARRGWI